MLKANVNGGEFGKGENMVINGLPDERLKQAITVGDDERAVAIVAQHVGAIARALGIPEATINAALQTATGRGALIRALRASARAWLS
jgi:hypothetical protein